MWGQPLALSGFPRPSYLVFDVEPLILHRHCSSLITHGSSLAILTAQSHRWRILRSQRMEPPTHASNAEAPRFFPGTPGRNGLLASFSGCSQRSIDHEASPTDLAGTFVSCFCSPFLCLSLQPARFVENTTNLTALNFTWTSAPVCKDSSRHAVIRATPMNSHSPRPQAGIFPSE